MPGHLLRIQEATWSNYSGRAPSGQTWLFSRPLGLLGFGLQGGLEEPREEAATESRDYGAGARAGFSSQALLTLGD